MREQGNSLMDPTAQRAVLGFNRRICDSVVERLHSRRDWGGEAEKMQVEEDVCHSSV